MMKRSMLLLFLLGLTWWVAPALAGAPVVMGDEDRWGCYVGNLHTDGYHYMDIPNEVEFKYVFYPLNYSCVSELGYKLDSVKMAFKFEACDFEICDDRCDDYCPIDLIVQVDLEDAVWDSDVNCLMPGPVDCMSEIIEVRIWEPDVYYIYVPLCNACACAFSDMYYFLSFHILEVDGLADGESIQVVVDDHPDACTSYIDTGGGWQDVVGALGWPGNPKIKGQVHFCCDPVANDVSTWGGIKNLYR